MLTFILAVAVFTLILSLPAYLVMYFLLREFTKDSQPQTPSLPLFIREDKFNHLMDSLRPPVTPKEDKKEYIPENTHISGYL